MSAAVHTGRFAADVTEPVVVFLIGMRVNRWWKVRRWWQVSSIMPRMLRRLGEHPELGLLHTELFPRGRTVLLVQYWRSHEHLQRFATDRDLPHAAAWARFTRELLGSGDVGIFHETYLVEPGQVEAVYGDMPVFGLAAATRHVPVGRSRNTAQQRLTTAAQPAR